MKWLVPLLMAVVLLCLWTALRVERVERAATPQTRLIASVWR